jgi:hypothetical protein|tara:strand:+ start:1976 stop:2341 length:366 start_codon:yes stop_codon:yes gene_type:complete
MGRNKGNKNMRGISKQKAKENSIRYRAMYDKWTGSKTTLEELGNEYAITKQRTWQIITRCKLGDGDYYYGVRVARNKWSEFKQLYSDIDQTKRAFDEWLKNREIKLISNNQKVAPHTGWDW